MEFSTHTEPSIALCAKPLSYVPIQDGAIGLSAEPAATRQQLILGEDMGDRPETNTSNDDRPPRGLDAQAQESTFVSPSSPPNEPSKQQAGNLKTIGTGDINSSTTSTSRALAGLELPCQEERIQTGIADGETSSRNGGNASDKLLNTYSSIGRRSAARGESATPRTQQICNTPNRHPLDTLRKKGFGGDYGSRSGGALNDGNCTADEIKKLRVSLKRAQEETARERERREVCEEQARVAYVSLETESKR